MNAPTPPVLHHPDDVTADWLTAVLGVPVRQLERDGVSSLWGAHVRLRAHVGDEVEPRLLRVKIGSSATFGRSEVDYYRHHFVELTDAPLVRCHHAAADDTHYHLLLDDLADSHANRDEPAPTEGYGRALVTAAARLHAHRWGGSALDPSAVDAALTEAEAGVRVMLDAMSDGFSEAERAQVRDTFAALPDALRRRYADRRGLSFVHGDLNPGNILTPRGGDSPVYLLDHQPFIGSSLTGLAVTDLAYAIVLWWPPELRRAWADDLVREWHAELCRRGVADYSLAAAREDWALAVRWSLCVPACRCGEPNAAPEMRWLWEMFLRRVLVALDDLGS